MLTFVVMATFKSKGIVFRTIKYGETSIITDIYTREKGLRSFIVNGVRKPKSRISASLFQHGMLLEMLAYDKQGGKLARIKEVKSDYIFRDLHFNIHKSSLSLFILELIRNTLQEHESNENLFDYLYKWFVDLDQWKEKIANLHLHFMVEFAGHIGFQPTNNYNEDRQCFDLETGHFVSLDGSYGHHSILDEEISRYIHQLMVIDRKELHTLNIPKMIRQRIIDSLLNYYKLHIEGFRNLKSYEVLKQIF